jgi:hypothetical protein
MPRTVDVCFCQWRVEPWSTIGFQCMCALRRSKPIKPSRGVDKIHGYCFAGCSQVWQRIHVIRKSRRREEELTSATNSIASYFLRRGLLDTELLVTTNLQAIRQPVSALGGFANRFSKPDVNPTHKYSWRAGRLGGTDRIARSAGSVLYGG